MIMLEDLQDSLPVNSYEFLVVVFDNYLDGISSEEFDTICVDPLTFINKLASSVNERRQKAEAIKSQKGE